ncbi:MBL fold metallo-hydrolase [Neobacillus drentensis]|uniref:MBL fold metallo-hydrolase n=1 Tax=Neobacillus drentensis TaxID=220684 RepID=UPI002FFEC070
MDYIFETVKENIYVLAVWDESWGSYNNCYFIVEEQSVTLIDSGKQQHAVFIEQALHSIGKSVDDVILCLATHGHEDHVQAASIFKHAKKVIHPNERDMIESPEPEQFLYELPSDGHFGEFDCQLVGYHTPGSVIFYHKPSKILFTGDFLCFFGDPLSPDGLVSVGPELREEWLKYLRNGGVTDKHLPPFLSGLEILSRFNPEAMCSGHGGVLTGEIKEFILALLKTGEKLLETAQITE